MGGNGLARTVDNDTVSSYLFLFDRLFITEKLSGWEPPMRAKARVRVKPKRYFADPSLVAVLVGALVGVGEDQAIALGDSVEAEVAIGLDGVVGVVGVLGVVSGRPGVGEVVLRGEVALGEVLKHPLQGVQLGGLRLSDGGLNALGQGRAAGGEKQGGQGEKQISLHD